MSVIRKQINTDIERQILIGVIVSDNFCRELMPIYDASYMEISFSPIIMNWGLSYFDKYQKAIGKHIQDVFKDWKKQKQDKEQVEFISAFLVNLSDEFEHAEKFNADYLMDKTVEYFKSQSMKNLSEDLKFVLAQGDIEAAEDVLSEYHKVEKVHNNGIDPFDNMEACRKAFEDRADTLFKLPGKLGELFNDELTRDSFVVLMGPEKRGKSWWLQFFAMQAHKARCNVAVFQAGDMSEGQSVRRFGITIAKKSDKKKFCGELLIPTIDCLHNQSQACTNPRRKGKYTVIDETTGQLEEFDNCHDYEPCDICREKRPKEFKGAVWFYKRPPVEPLTWQEAFKLSVEYKKRVRAKGFKLATYSNRTLNVEMMEAQLDAWERTEGFVADVIIADYPDIFKNERGLSDGLDAINGRWMALRGLSQSKHACLIVATQTTKASHAVRNIQLEHVADDKRKLAHATAIYALNQIPEEKKIGVMRISPLLVREDVGNIGVESDVTILQSIATGRPYLDSY